ncbi:hypothetical protein HOY80DRAFT_884262, partial [Tuber brumale]
IIQDFFSKLTWIIRTNKIQPHNIYNIDQKGFTLGFSAWSQVFCPPYRQNPLVMQDRSHELLTVLECFI